MEKIRAQKAGIDFRPTRTPECQDSPPACSVSMSGSISSSGTV